MRPSIIVNVIPTPFFPEELIEHPNRTIIRSNFILDIHLSLSLFFNFLFHFIKNVTSLRSALRSAVRNEQPWRSINFGMEQVRKGLGGDGDIRSIRKLANIGRKGESKR